MKPQRPKYIGSVPLEYWKFVMSYIKGIVCKKCIKVIERENT